jgi:hypothetical protein
MWRSTYKLGQKSPATLEENLTGLAEKSTPASPPLAPTAACAELNEDQYQPSAALEASALQLDWQEQSKWNHLIEETVSLTQHAVWKH